MLPAHAGSQDGMVSLAGLAVVVAVDSFFPPRACEAAMLKEGIVLS